jgi:hypothetical protein
MDPVGASCHDPNLSAFRRSGERAGERPLRGLRCPADPTREWKRVGFFLDRRSRVAISVEQAAK